MVEKQEVVRKQQSNGPIFEHSVEHYAQLNIFSPESCFLGYDSEIKASLVKVSNQVNVFAEWQGLVEVGLNTVWFMSIHDCGHVDYP